MYLKIAQFVTIIMFFLKKKNSDCTWMIFYEHKVTENISV